MLAQASLLAQKVAYYQKWQVHRRGRPEPFGGVSTYSLDAMFPEMDHQDDQQWVRRWRLLGSY